MVLSDGMVHFLKIKKILNKSTQIYQNYLVALICKEPLDFFCGTYIFIFCLFCLFFPLLLPITLIFCNYCNLLLIIMLFVWILKINKNIKYKKNEVIIYRYSQLSLHRISKLNNRLGGRSTQKSQALFCSNKSIVFFTIHKLNFH